MKKREIAILSIPVLILCVGIAWLAINIFSAEDAPDFIYTSQMQTSGSAAATAATSASQAPPTSSATTTVTTESTSEPTESFPILLTTNDPENYAELQLQGNTFYIKGYFNSDEVTGVFVGDNSVKPAYNDDGTFEAKLEIQNDGYNNVTLKFSEDKPQSFRFYCDSNEAHIVFCDNIAEQSENALQHIIDIPQTAVDDYIVTNGTDEQRETTLEEIAEISAQVCDGLHSDYDKARALSEWVSLNIYYDSDAYNSSVTTETLSLCKTLEEHRSVCGGYANLYAALCQSQGIECYIVQGSVVQNNYSFEEDVDIAPSHEWNAVFIDGRFIWVDSLWNTDNFYKNGKYVESVQGLKYFDITTEALSQNHCAKRVERREFFGIS
ncbi:MAG: transglutaminase domain-containing protein [Ruminococcaceae bacterium]|nr:transglutaminase domain-containing protein [Oscillospiraceae bacterium]